MILNIYLCWTTKFLKLNNYDADLLFIFLFDMDVYDFWNFLTQWKNLPSTEVLLQHCVFTCSVTSYTSAKRKCEIS